MAKSWNTPKLTVLSSAVPDAGANTYTIEGSGTMDARVMCDEGALATLLGCGTLDEASYSVQQTSAYAPSS